MSRTPSSPDATGMDHVALLAAAHAWHALDPDPDTRSPLMQWIRSEDHAALAACFDGELDFGTAGVRAPLGPGPRRMNRLSVRRIGWAVAEWLRGQPDAATEAPVVIGYDARYKSAVFAAELQAVLQHFALPVRVCATPIPTPVLAFAVRHARARAGLMVTASHNPPMDNGVKVYGPNGVQVVPPVDDAIVAGLPTLTALAALQVPEALQAEVDVVWTEALGEAYLAAIQAALPPVSQPPEAALAAQVTVAYTPLHGVGGRWTERAVAALPHVKLVPVACQMAPDPDFSTVRLPNPEERATLALLLETAAAHDCDLAVAHDPDADRLAVALRGADGDYHVLHGNDLGCLLADHLLAHHQGPRPLVLNTVVSSPLLGRIAAAHGAHWEQTLTGFKWIATRAAELEQGGELQFCFGYEEALGYTPSRVVGDKDGIATLLVVLRLCAAAKACGHTLRDAVAALQRQHGWYHSGQRVLPLDTPAQRQAMEQQIRLLQQCPPHQLGRWSVLHVQDFELGHEGAPGAPWQAFAAPRTRLLVFRLSDGHRVMLRPSGTEPKLKLYADAYAPPQADDPLDPQVLLAALAAQLEAATG